MLDTTDPNALIIETARRFAQERLAPTAAAREKAGRIEPEIIRELGEMGFLGATNSAEWGGSEIPYETYAQVIEELAAGDGSVSTLVSVHNAPTCEILERFGTPAQTNAPLHPIYGSMQFTPAWFAANAHWRAIQGTIYNTRVAPGFFIQEGQVSETLTNGVWIIRDEYQEKKYYKE